MTLRLIFFAIVTSPSTGRAPSPFKPGAHYRRHLAAPTPPPTPPYDAGKPIYQNAPGCWSGFKMTDTEGADAKDRYELVKNRDGFAVVLRPLCTQHNIAGLGVIPDHTEAAEADAVNSDCKDCCDTRGGQFPGGNVQCWSATASFEKCCNFEATPAPTPIPDRTSLPKEVDVFDKQWKRYNDTYLSLPCTNQHTCSVRAVALRTLGYQWWKEARPCHDGCDAPTYLCADDAIETCRERYEPLIASVAAQARGCRGGLRTLINDDQLYAAITGDRALFDASKTAAAEACARTGQNTKGNDKYDGFLARRGYTPAPTPADVGDACATVGSEGDETWGGTAATSFGQLHQDLYTCSYELQPIACQARMDPFGLCQTETPATEADGAWAEWMFENRDCRPGGPAYRTSRNEADTEWLPGAVCDGKWNLANDTLSFQSIVEAWESRCSADKLALTSHSTPMSRAASQGILAGCSYPFHSCSAKETCKEALDRPARRLPDARQNMFHPIILGIVGVLFVAICAGGLSLRNKSGVLRRGVSVAIDTVEDHTEAQAVMVTKVARGGQIISYKV